MSPIDKPFRAAVTHFQSGELDLAQRICRELLTANPDHADALHMLGMIASQARQQQEATQLLRRASALRPRDAALANNLGELLRQQNQLDEAVAQFHIAARVAPSFPEPHYNLGIALKSLERRDEATQAFVRAIQLRPSYARAHYNLANLLREEGRARLAVDHYRRALAGQPDWADAHLNLGNTYFELGEWQPALSHLQTAQRLDPTNAEIDATIGNLHLAAGDVEQAAACYRRSLPRQSNRWLATLKVESLAEPIPPDAGYIEAYQARLSGALAHIADAPHALSPETLHCSGAEPPMALAYQGRDVRPILERYAELFAAAIAPLAAKKNLGKPRIGVVVTRGHEGVFARCWGGIAERLSRELLDVRLVCSRSGANVLRELLRIDEREYLVLPERIDQAAELLRESAFDLLHYWEIGTDSTNYCLPFFRPAPLQSTCGGWPVTSGNERVSHFVSGRSLEPEGAQPHYRESLVLLKHLPMFYERPLMPGGKPITAGRRPTLEFAGRERFGVAPGEHMYLCTQNLRKYHPDCDPLLAEILRRDPRGRLCMIADSQPAITRRLMARLGRSMPDVVSRIQMLERMPLGDYLQAVAAADLALDTFPYAGGVNTVYDALAVGTPLVSLPGAFHRGRWALAAYSQLGISETIAMSPADYVERAVRIGTEPDFRRHLAQRILARCDELFADARTVAEHEAFFLQAIAAMRSGRADA